MARASRRIAASSQGSADGEEDTSRQKSKSSRQQEMKCATMNTSEIVTGPCNELEDPSQEGAKMLYELYLQSAQLRDITPPRNGDENGDEDVPIELITFGRKRCPDNDATYTVRCGKDEFQLQKFNELASSSTPSVENSQFWGVNQGKPDGKINGAKDYSPDLSTRHDAAIPDHPDEIMFARYLARWLWPWLHGNESPPPLYLEKLKKCVGEESFQRWRTNGLGEEFRSIGSVGDISKSDLVALLRYKFSIYGTGRIHEGDKSKQREFMKLPWPLGQKNAHVNFKTDYDLQGCKNQEFQKALLSEPDLIVAFYVANIMKEWNRGRIVFVPNSNGTVLEGHHLIHISSGKGKKNAHCQQMSDWLKSGTRLSWGRLTGWCTSVLLDCYKRCYDYFKNNDGIINAHGIHLQCDNMTTVRLPDNAMKRIGGSTNSATDDFVCVTISHVGVASQEVNEKNKFCPGRVGTMTTAKENGENVLKISVHTVCRCTGLLGNPGGFACTKIQWQRATQTGQNYTYNIPTTKRDCDDDDEAEKDDEPENSFECLGDITTWFQTEDDAEDDEAEKDDRPKIPGIRNLCNTCYLSASLQILYSIPQFLHKLYQSYEELSSTKELPLTTALLEVAVTIGALKEEDAPSIFPNVDRSTLSNSKVADPSALKKQMDVLTDKFEGNEQRDAHEFLGDLVDFLHEELVDSPNADGKDDKPKESDEAKSEDGEEGEEVGATVVTTDLPTDEYFHVKVRVCLKCKSCGYSRSKEELYRHLSIDIGGDDDGESWGVERGLEKFFQAEDRELKCEKCEDGICATQTMEIISRPKAILLHFKRFFVTFEDNGEMVNQKKSAEIHLKDSLDISPFFSSEEEKPMCPFHLSAVAHHVGTTAYSGHYTTCAKRKLDDEEGEEWVLFDDEEGKIKTINYVTGDEADQKNCYMALYALKESKVLNENDCLSAEAANESRSSPETGKEVKKSRAASSSRKKRQAPSTDKSPSDALEPPKKKKSKTSKAGKASPSEGDVKKSANTKQQVESEQRVHGPTRKARKDRETEKKVAKNAKASKKKVAAEATTASAALTKESTEATSSKKRKRSLCTVESCSNQARSGGVCHRHGANKTLCKVDECPNLAISNGVCINHGAKTATKKKRLRKQCSVDDCTSFARVRGVCIKHGATQQRKQCTVEGCTKQVQQGGVCIRHGANVKKCSSEGCENTAQQGGVCCRHGARVQTCSADGCANQVQNGGVCVQHGANVPKCSVRRCKNNAKTGGLCKKHAVTPPKSGQSKRKQSKKKNSQNDRQQSSPQQQQNAEESSSNNNNSNRASNSNSRERSQGGRGRGRGRNHQGGRNNGRGNRGGSKRT